MGEIRNVDDPKSLDGESDGPSPGPLDLARAYIVGIGLLSGLVWRHRSFTQATNEPRRAGSLRSERSCYEPPSPVAVGTAAVELRQGEDRHSTPDPGSEHVGRPVSPGGHTLHAHQSDQGQ